jgi:hypothetical protein
MASLKYQPLEKDLTSSLATIPSLEGGTSLLGVSTYIYTLFFVAIICAAFYRYVLAGIWRMEASESGVKKSNDAIKKTTLGLLGVFGLFLILFTVNKGMLTGDVGLEGLKSGSVVSGGSQSTTGAGEVPTTGTQSGGQSGESSLQEDPAVRKQLKDAGISINKPVCPTITDTNCTTVGGLPADTISMLLSLRSSCPTGNLEVTGGTERGHDSHGPGKYPVDIGIKAGTLNSCIRAGEKKETPSFCTEAFSNFGFIFCNEKETNHWHVYK